MIDIFPIIGLQEFINPRVQMWGLSPLIGLTDLSILGSNWRPLFYHWTRWIYQSFNSMISLCPIVRWDELINPGVQWQTCLLSLDSLSLSNPGSNDKPVSYHWTPWVYQPRGPMTNLSPIIGLHEFINPGVQWQTCILSLDSMSLSTPGSNDKPLSYHWTPWVDQPWVPMTNLSPIIGLHEFMNPGVQWPTSLPSLDSMILLTARSNDKPLSYHWTPWFY